MLALDTRDGGISSIAVYYIGIGVIQSSYNEPGDYTTYYISGLSIDMEDGSSNSLRAVGLQTTASWTGRVGYAIVF